MSAEIEHTIRAAVERALESRMAELRSAVAGEVAAALEPALAARGAAHPPGGAPTDVLNAAIASLHDGASQTEILQSLVDGAARFSGRCVLFVVRGTMLQAWQARGFANNDAVRGLQVGTETGLVARALKDRSPAAAAAAEFDSAFVAAQGNPCDGNAVVLPLILKEKPVAVLYADAGLEQGGALDVSALHALTRAASVWLELLALRKAGGAGQASAQPEMAPMSAPPAPQAPPAVAAAPAPVPSPAPQVSAAAAPAPAAASGEDDELHKKAKRFAKLLVDEIKLYNQAKLAQAKQERQIYRVLREDIEKSRATYDKRYGSTPAASGDYFTGELVRVLADNDRSLLGAEFPS